MKRRLAVLAAIFAAATSMFITPPAPAAATVADLPNGAPDIDVAAVKAHLNQLQTIATNQGNGNRCTGSGGFTGSVGYVTEQARAAGYTVTEQPFTTPSGRRSSNVLAELPGQDTSTVIMAGGHLDSVCAGPGINDNGSGSAGILAVAQAFAAANPNPSVTVRFGWWGDEEAGLNGSEHYADSLSGSERTRIKAYLNFDMIASPNAGYFVYNDDDDTIEATINAYFAEIGWPTEGQGVGGRSDSASFQRVGIRTGGIFTGAENIKSASQAQKWGGQSGVAFDRCYHSSCDTIGNIDDAALNRNSDAISWTIWELTGGGDQNPGGPSVTNPGDQSTVVNTPVSLALRASGGTTPYTWRASGLPAGLSVNASTGVVSGTPSVTGTSDVTVTVTDAANQTGSVSLKWTVTPAGGSCGSHEFTVDGSLSDGQVDVQPDGTWYQSTTSGRHSADLCGPAGTDFDLYLQKWNGFSWADVAEGVTPGNVEAVSYDGTAGYYRYQVHAYAGSGDYTLGYTNP